MLPIRSMVASKSKPWNIEPCKWLRCLASSRASAWVGADVLAGGDQEASGATGRVADLVAWLGCGHVHHQLDDVARGAELAVDPGRGHLAQQVLVQVAVGVAVGHRNAVEHVNDLAQQGGGRDGEPSVAHVLGVGGTVSAELGAQPFQIVEDRARDGGVHHVRRGVPKPGPAKGSWPGRNIWFSMTPVLATRALLSARVYRSSSRLRNSR